MLSWGSFHLKIYDGPCLTSTLLASNVVQSRSSLVCLLIITLSTFLTCSSFDIQIDNSQALIKKFTARSGSLLLLSYASVADKLYKHADLGKSGERGFFGKFMKVLAISEFIS